jgi:hypothetical protein
MLPRIVATHAVGMPFSLLFYSICLHAGMLDYRSVPGHGVKPHLGLSGESGFTPWTD